MIHLYDLQKSYVDSNGKKLDILNVERFSIQKGEQIALIGPSGSGKSTLLHIIGGVIEADQGQIELDGKEIQQLNAKEKDAFRAKYIGYIFQDFHLIPSLTAEENVRLAIPLDKKNKWTEQIDMWFHRVGLSTKLHVYPHELSRGQQQRVALIRAFIHQPDIILADEPTGSLDQQTGSDMMALLLELCSMNQTTLLCVTHDLTLVKKFEKTLHMDEINMFTYKGVHE